MSSEARPLADSLIRFHGAARAQKLADQYAIDAADKSDSDGYEKWAAAAAIIGAYLSMKEGRVK